MEIQLHQQPSPKEQGAFKDNWCTPRGKKWLNKPIWFYNIIIKMLIWEKCHINTVKHSYPVHSKKILHLIWPCFSYFLECFCHLIKSDQLYEVYITTFLTMYKGFYILLSFWNKTNGFNRGKYSPATLWIPAQDEPNENKVWQMWEISFRKKKFPTILICIVLSHIFSSYGVVLFSHCLLLGCPDIFRAFDFLNMKAPFACQADVPLQFAWHKGSVTKWLSSSIHIAFSFYWCWKLKYFIIAIQLCHSSSFTCHRNLVKLHFPRENVLQGTKDQCFSTPESLKKMEL